MPYDITFPQGLIGCEAWRRFRLFESSDAGPVRLLECLDDPDVGFLVVSPDEVCDEYSFEMPEAARLTVGLTSDDDSLVLCTLMVRHEPHMVAANLLGPLVVNSANGQGVQVLLANSEYSSRHVISAPPREA